MPRIARLIAFALLALLPTASATSAAPLRERIAERRAASEPAQLPKDTRTWRNVHYGPDPRQTLDVFAPPLPAGEAGPVLVMVHGGGWRFGDKASPGVVGAKAMRWLPRGFVLVSVNYRMLPDHDVRAQADDIARAIAFVQGQAGRFGGDPRRVVLLGHSAGAHLAALVSAAPARWRALGLQPWLGTIALDGAALDVEAVMRKHHLRLLDAAFGDDPVFWRATSPAATLQAGGVPLLAVCSRLRRDDPCAQSDAFATRAQAFGVRAEVLGQALSHRDINHRLGEPSGYTLAVERFMGSLDAELARRLAGGAR